MANRTSEHQDTVASLASLGFRGRLLVEKPLLAERTALPKHQFALAVVAYNLRMHPLLRRLRDALRDETAATASIYVGSYLPSWRPEDYRVGYAASKAQGGGVLRDLSHEIDYTLWLFGPWKRLAAHGGHVSTLEIDTEDAFTIMMEAKRCPLVSIHMNYLDRATRRDVGVTTDRHSYRVDLVTNSFAIDGATQQLEIERDDTYRAEHQAMLSGDTAGLCTLEEGIETLAVIEAAERAAAKKEWVAR